MKAGRWRSIAEAGLLTAFTGFACLGLAEVAVRYIAPQPPSWIDIYRRHPKLPLYALQPSTTRTAETGETRWTVITDAEGHRVGSLPQPSGACTDLWLGDSFTFGHGVDYETSFVGQLATGKPEIRMVNLAVPGYGPTQYRQVLESELSSGLMHFNRVTTVLYVGNDFHDCVWSKDVAVNDGVVGDRGDLRSKLKRASHLYRLAAVAFHRMHSTPEDPFQAVLDELADPTAWGRNPLKSAYATFRDEVARIDEVARRHGAFSRFVILPTQAAVRAREGGDALLPVQMAARALAESRAQVLDTTPFLRAHAREPLFFPFDGHLNELGNRVVAEAIRSRWNDACSSAHDTSRPSLP